MPLYAIENVASQVAAPVEPWTFRPEIPPDVTTSKAAFKAWFMDINTKHCHYSGFEGATETVRVSDGNEPHRVHGFVADYDWIVTPEDIEKLKKHKPYDISPAWVSKSFSGNGRLVWMLEEPVLVGSIELAKALVKAVMKDMNLGKWMSGLDSDAFLDPARYYEVGSDWQKISDDVIPVNRMHRWLSIAGRKIQPVKVSYSIPLEKLEEAVHEKFPGRWQGEFVENKMGVRFWDDQADCPTGCIIRTWGMQCFTGPKPFMRWDEIFGREFVEQYEADRIGPIRNNTYFDGGKFWCFNPAGVGTWQETAKDDFAQKLRVAGFSSRLQKGQTCTEVDRIEAEIKTHRMVTGARPFVHFPTGLMQWNGKSFLNTSTAKCLQPAPEGSVRDYEHGRLEMFPILWQYMHTLLEPASALEYMHAWIKHFYENGLYNQPKPGHAIILAGDPGVGKTFFSNGFISKLVGGHSDASTFLVEGSPWSDTVANHPLMAVDDANAASTPQGHMRFSNMVKKAVACQTMGFNGKWQKNGDVLWMGRVIITCNLDPESLRMLPNMELSTMDKISLFKARNIKFIQQFGFKQLDEILAKELPYYARWLLDWKIPSHLISKDRRFGVVPYHHPDLVRAAVHQGPSHALAEFLSSTMDMYRAAHPEKQFWVGTATELYKDMQLCSEPLARQWTYSRLSTALGQLQSRGFNLYGLKHLAQTSTMWVIPFNLMPRGEVPDEMSKMIQQDVERASQLSERHMLAEMRKEEREGTEEQKGSVA